MYNVYFRINGVKKNLKSGFATQAQATAYAKSFIMNMIYDWDEVVIESNGVEVEIFD